MRVFVAKDLWGLYKVINFISLRQLLAVTLRGRGDCVFVKGEKGKKEEKGGGRDSY